MFSKETYKEIGEESPHYGILIAPWIFAGVMGRLIPVFFIPVVRSLRPHYFVAAVIAYIALLHLLNGKFKNFTVSNSVYSLSLILWFYFIVATAISFLNLKPIEVLLYPRQSGYDSLIVKYAFLVILMLLCRYFYHIAVVEKDLIRKVVILLDKSFTVFFLVGWPLYMATVLGVISRGTFLLFTVQSRMEAVVPRFFPGDYANGTGEMLAFYVVFILLMRRHIKYVPIKFLLGTTGLLLTTTRGAIIPALVFLFGFVMIDTFKKIVGFKLKINHRLIRSVIVYFLGILLMSLLIVNIGELSNRITMLYKGIIAFHESQSVQERFIRWDESLDILRNSSYMGSGFGTNLSTHSVLFQLLAEVGVLGAIFFIMFIASRMIVTVQAYFKCSFGRADMKADFTRMVMIAMLVNIFFALTNHNLFHFTFWFLIISTFIVEAQVFSHKRIEAT